MTGSKTTSMTLDAMRTARQQGESRSDLARVRQEAAADIEPAMDHDSPDAGSLIRAAITQRRAGRPAGSGNKEQVALRVDHDVLAAFRAGGPGWQTRMNAALREWLTQHPPHPTVTKP